MSTSQGTVAVATVLALSISLPLMSGSIPLPGDPELEITPSISRGELSVFILVWLVVALLTAGYRLMKTVSSSTQNRILLGSHMAHLGIVVLLVGHVLTTTLVDRSDPSHLVTLDNGEPLEHQGLELVFQDVQVISSDDEEYDFAIGDGFVGITIEVRDDGERIVLVEPVMLRFDSPGLSTSRSEVARLTMITGDTIVILDRAQTNEILLKFL